MPSTKKNRKKSGNAAKQVSITKRFVNTKRHTIAYVVGGKRLSVRKTAELAGQGRISGVRRVGNHVQSQANRRSLTNLPTTVE
jgi:hypothetical protein